MLLVAKSQARLVLNGSQLAPRKSLRLLSCMLATPLPRGRAKGLAWFSPSRGIWLAVDGLVSPSGDRVFQLTASVAEREPIRLGTVRVDPDGSGRMASVGAWVDTLARGGPLVFIVSDASGDVRLTGSVSVDSLRRASSRIP